MLSMNTFEGNSPIEVGHPILIARSTLGALLGIRGDVPQIHIHKIWMPIKGLVSQLGWYHLIDPSSAF
jgi:hypothetical protein